MTLQKEFAVPLSHLRAIPFVRRLRFIPARGGDRDIDGIAELTTPHGRCNLPVQLKKSYLTQALVNAILGRSSSPARSRSKDKSRTKSATNPVKLVLARYIPSGVAEQFVNAGISFADDSGNVHLRIGSQYNWTILGNRRPPKLPEAYRTTPAAIQLLFQFAVNPESAAWPVRDLALTAGISKTKVAQLRSQFLHERILTGKSQFRLTSEIIDRLVAGYSQILRPKLLVGRYRYPDSSVEQFLARVPGVVRARKIGCALTGGPAAELMQHFYHGPDVPLFLDQYGADILRGLRLLPDGAGPVVVLRSFGNIVYWREFDGMMVAPPWLTYAELLTTGEPRAREAAEQLRREYLQ